MALAQLLIVAGRVSESQDRNKAIGYLLEATNVSQAKGFRHNSGTRIIPATDRQSELLLEDRAISDASMAE
jgi:hypothetical protein